MSEQACTLEVTPLSNEERARFRQLQLVVERGLSQFLEVAAALKEIREQKYYRETHPTFESFCRERYALARSTVDIVIRSGSTAQLLIDNGAELPANTSEATIRPISSLPTPELQLAGWKLLEKVSPECGPTQPIASKVCRVIKNAIESEVNGDGNGHKPRRRDHTQKETPFLRPVQRLSAYQGFDAELVVSHVEKLPSAWNVYSACEEMIRRCRQVEQHLAERFPDVARPC
jgi:hypothetical protein